MPVYYFFILLSGFLLGIFFINIFRKFSLVYKFLIPKETPLIGGMAIGVSFILISLLSFSFFKHLSKEIIGIIVSSTVILIFGLIDDWRELSIWLKFFAQIIATSLLILFGVRTQIVYIGNPLNIIITFIWVIGITNALNHLDILDGLAASIAAIASLGFLSVSFLNGDIKTIILILALIGPLISFLIYNFPPAKIYMGNSGSHFLGFVLAAIALVISYAPLTRKVALLSPLLILGLPIFDTTFLTLMRMAKKKLPFKKSDDHLTLRFLTLGYSKKKTLFTILIWALFFSLCGVLLSQVSNLSGVIIIIFALLLTLNLTIRMVKVSIDG